MRVRPPVIAGLAPGCGTSTLAAALHALDAGLLRPGVAGEADVVVCPAGALRQATLLACAASGPRPVLAVVLDATGRDALAQRLVSVRARFAAVVALPHVARWHGADVREEAAGVLAHRGEHLTEPVRTYAGALRILVRALAAGGALGRTAPPMVSRPATSGGLRPGPRTGVPVEPSAPPSPPPAPACAELDDEALEALLPPPVPAGRAG